MSRKQTAIGTNRVRSHSLVGLAIVLTLFAFLSLCTIVPRQPLAEDAFITFRYVQNFLDGNGLVFNRGERVEAISNFLWAIVLALFSKAGFPLLTTALMAGLVIGALTIAAVWLFSVLYLERDGWFQFVAPLLLATEWFFVHWCGRGLETALYTLLVTAGTMSFVLESEKTRPFPCSAILFALASMTRPEGPLLFAGILFMLVLRDISNRKLSTHTVFSLLWFLLVYGSFMGFRIYYYHDIVPTSVFSKAAANPPYKANLCLLASNFIGTKGYLIFLPALFSLSGPNARKSFVKAVIAVVGFHSVHLVFISSHSHSQVSRLVIPVLPLTFLLVQEGLIGISAMVKRVGAGTRTFKQTLVGLFAVFIILANFLGKGVLYSWPSRAPRHNPALATAVRLIDTPSVMKEKLAAWRNLQAIPENPFAQFGHWIGENVPPNSVIVYDHMGQVPFYAGLRYTFVDSWGLTDRVMAQIRHGERNVAVIRARKLVLGLLTGSSGESNLKDVTFSEYIYSRSPDYVFLGTPPKEIRDLVSTSDFNQKYEEFFPAGNFATRRSYRKRPS